MSPLSLLNFKLQGKKVLMRVDFNVPLKDGKITNDERIQAAMPSIEYILEQGCSLILMSHLGKPKGKIDPAFSLKPVAERLSELLNLSTGQKVLMAKDCIGTDVETQAKELKPGEILLLENLRFHGAEEKPDTDPSFAKQLSTLADVYVNDAFGTCHRKHSSTYTVVQYFKDKALMGFLIEKELKYLDQCIKDPKRPFYAIIGGAKLSSKIKVLSGLLDKVDELFIGGAMAYPFLKNEGISLGKSLFEEGSEKIAKEILKKAQEKKVKINLPEDLVIADDFKNEAQIKIISTKENKENIPEQYMGMDIGPKTAQNWKVKFLQAQTIFWNGPVGVFEMQNFMKGTQAVAESIADSKAVSVIGGGDSVAAIAALNLKEKFTHLSTGGGASLEYLENGQLPCIEALTKRDF